MNEKPNYYAIIPADVRYDDELTPNAKLLYGEITALSNKEGYCYASNTYFAELYKVSNRTIIRMINNLVNKGYLEKMNIYKKGTKEILQRRLYLVTKITLPSDKNVTGGNDKNVTDNNTSINNTSINKKEIYKERFKKPTLEEIKQYCIERNNNVDPKKFIDFYEVNNWIDSQGNKVKNWKQKIITWETHQERKKEDIIPDWFNKDLDNPDLATAEEMNKLLEEIQE